MLQVRRILFPTDYSSCAAHAFTHAAHLAQRYGASGHILHVREDDAQEVSDSFAYTDAGDWERSVVTHESVPQAILEFADRSNVDLIVLGTHGRRPLERLIMGSVAERVVRLAPCPVLTVHARAEGSLDKMRRILVPVDFSEHANLALAYAAELSAAYEADLDLLHIVPDDSLPLVYGAEPAGVGGALLGDRARLALDALAGQVAGSGRTIRTHVFIGHPASDIVEFAEAQQDGMIVIATHGRSNLERFFLGSVADKVIRRAPCPVFVVKSFGRRLLDASVSVPRPPSPPRSP